MRVAPRFGRKHRALSEKVLQFRNGADLRLSNGGVFPIYTVHIGSVLSGFGTESDAGVALLKNPKFMTVKPAYKEDGTLIDILKGDQFFRLKYLGEQKESETYEEFSKRIVFGTCHVLTVHSMEEQENALRILGELE